MHGVACDCSTTVMGPHSAVMHAHAVPWPVCICSQCVCGERCMHICMHECMLSVENIKMDSLCSVCTCVYGYF